MTFGISQKLATGFVVMSLLAGGLGLYQLNMFSEAMRVASAIAAHDVQMVQRLREISQQQSSARVNRELAISTAALTALQGTRLDVGSYRRQYAVASGQAVAALQQLAGFLDRPVDRSASAQRRDIWRDLNRKAGDLVRLFDQAAQGTEIFDLLAQGRLSEAVERRVAVERIREAIEQELDSLAQSVDQLVQTGQSDIAATYQQARRSLIIAITLVLLAGLFTAWLMSRSIVRPLAHFMAFARSIGQGDLTGAITTGRRDELGQLGRHLNQMVANLKDIAGQTRSTAEDVNAATSQIRASTQEQAATVAEQMAAVEETSATLNDITASGARIAGRAQELVRNADAVSLASESGLRAVEDTIQVMDAIREQAETVAETIVMLSQRTQAIGEIIATVNDIAERSHLLALNAAIEAAAAGEHGRSFSVVAAEIKTLADQAKEATAQVRTNLVAIQQGINASVMLTEEAVKRVGAGKRQTDAAEHTIRELSEAVRENALAFQQIVAATNQQQIGLEQVMQALHSIRHASGQATISTHQLEEATVNLNALSEQLVGAVRSYRL